MLRPRIAIAAFTLLALAAFHLTPSDAALAPQRPVTPPVAATGSSRAADAHRLTVVLEAAQKAYERDVWAWVANAPKPRPVRAARTASLANTGAAPAEAPSYDPGSIEGIICAVFGDACPHALQIARCESNLNPTARNRSGAAGLFQLLNHGDLFEAHGWSPDDWADPYKNSVVAFDLSAGGTRWGSWVCR